MQRHFGQVDTKGVKFAGRLLAVRRPGSGYCETAVGRLGVAGDAGRVVGRRAHRAGRRGGFEPVPDLLRGPDVVLERRLDGVHRKRRDSAFRLLAAAVGPEFDAFPSRPSDSCER